jgi:exosortase/archaeosortase family protein
MTRDVERGSPHPVPPRASGEASAVAGRPGTRKPPRYGEVRAVLGFLARFAGGWIATLVVLSFVPAIDRWAVGHTISSLLLVTHLFQVASTGANGSITIAGISIEIVPDCTPLMPTAVLWIAIAAFPAPWRTRLLGLAAGAILLWLYNMARILALVPVLAHRPEIFEFVHVYLWQTMTLLVVFAMFLLWLRLQQPRAARA